MSNLPGTSCLTILSPTAQIFHVGNKHMGWPNSFPRGARSYEFSRSDFLHRTIRDPDNDLPTGHYHENELATAPKICPGLSVEDLPLHSAFTDGTAVVEDDAEEEGLKRQEIDCIDRKLTSRNEVTDPVAITCKIRVDKCCALDEVFSHQEQGCVRGQSEIRFHQLETNKPRLMQIPGFIDNDLKNETSEAYEKNISSLIILDQKVLRLIDQTEKERFCVETVVDGPRKETKVLVFPDGPVGAPDPVLYPEISARRESCTATLAIYTALGSVSIISLIAMISIYLVLPELRNHHGLIVVSCAFSTLLATLFLVIVYNFDQQPVEELDRDVYIRIPTTRVKDDSGCTFLGFFGIFSNLSMFTWMSVMCWDLARTFSRMRPPSTRVQTKKFLTYSAFGWLLPLLFTIICLILQHASPYNSAFNPGIGFTTCFVDNLDIPARQFTFFHLPMLLLLLSNVVGFAFCLYHIHKTQKGARPASQSVDIR